MREPRPARFRRASVTSGYLLAQLLVVAALAVPGSWPVSPAHAALLDSALQSVAAGLAAVFILALSGAYRQTRRAWRWAGMAALLWCGGQTWLTVQLVSGRMTRPSPADLMFVVAVLCALLAAASFPSLPPGPRGRWRLVLDAFVMAGSVAFLVLDRLGALLPPFSQQVALAFAYPVADWLIITVLLIAAMRAPHRLLPSLGTAVLGLLVLSVTNLEVFRMALEGMPTLASSRNAGFALGLALVGLGALLQTDASEVVEAAQDEQPVARSQRLLPYLLVPVVLALVIAANRSPHGASLVLLVVLAGLLLLRQLLVVEENSMLAGDVVRRSHRFEALVQGSSELVLVLDAEGAVSYASPSVTEVLGAEPGAAFALFVAPEDSMRFARSLEQARTDGRGTCRFRVSATAGPRVLDARFTDRRTDPAVAGVVVNARDVTEETAAQVSLADSERRYRRIVETAQEGIWVTDSMGITRFINARAAEMIGLPLEGLVGRPTLELLSHLLDRDQIAAVRAKMLDRSRGCTAAYDMSLTRPDGRPVHAHVSASPLFDAEGNFDGALTMITDITARVEAENQLRQDARTDSLTGLANRAQLSERVAEALAEFDPDRPPALVYCDLDGFKAINDAWGHSAGDELLRNIAERLRAIQTPSTTMSRLGGDEFAILLSATQEGEAEAFARRLMAALKRPYSLGGRDHHIDLSVGIAVAAPTDDVESLLRNADLAMYQAKNDGRGRLRRYERAMHTKASARLRLEQDLRHALSRDELLLHYQPVVSLATGECVGAEALIRWKHPTLGMVAPDQFIPVAEGSDLILAIGGWVLERAMADAAQWPVLDHRQVLSVNVAPQQLMDDGHVAELEAMLRDSALPADQVILEVTERSLLAGDRPRDALRTLRATGARLALDDFGTGYSSIAHLRDHPVDVLKLDRSYVTQVTSATPSRRLAMVIVNMSRELGISCTAEGIETQAQAVALAEAGCAHAQGYLFAPPMTQRDLLRWMGRQGLALPRPRTADQDSAARLG